jgi:hypothetical protein
MNRYELFVLVFLSCIPAYSQDYFPLHLNDEWRYKLLYEVNQDYYMVSQIVDTTTVAGTKYFVRRNLYNYTGSIPEFDTLRSDNNIVYQYSDNQESVMYDLRCSTEVRDTVGSKIMVKWPVDTLTLGDTVVADLVYYFTDYVGMADGQMSTWFGENIGIVKEAYFRSAPSLTYAKINGRVVFNTENTPIRFSQKKPAVTSHTITGRFDFLGRKVANIQKNKLPCPMIILSR